MIEPVYYAQADPKWGKHNYSAKGESKTISSSGCGPTSAAMILQTLRPDKTITPITTADWSMAHNYKALNQGTFYTYFVPQFKEYGITCKQLNSANIYKSTSDNAKNVRKDIKKALKEPGTFIIACMGAGNWTSAGHFVVAWKVDAIGNVYIKDPAGRGNGRSGIPRLKAPFTTWANEIKYCWSVKYGTKYKVKKAGYLYSKRDSAKANKLSTIGTTDSIWHIKDCKDGWSLVTDGTKVGYCKNSLINAVGLSGYLKLKNKNTACLREKKVTTSKLLAKVQPGGTFTIIFKRGKWYRAKYTDPKSKQTLLGWVLASRF